MSKYWRLLASMASTLSTSTSLLAYIYIGNNRLPISYPDTHVPDPHRQEVGGQHEP